MYPPSFHMNSWCLFTFVASQDGFLTSLESEISSTIFSDPCSNMICKSLAVKISVRFCVESSKLFSQITLSSSCITSSAAVPFKEAFSTLSASRHKYPGCRFAVLTLTSVKREHTCVLLIHTHFTIKISKESKINCLCKIAGLIVVR